MQRDKKLDELQKQLKLAQSERKVLEDQLAAGGGAPIAPASNLLLTGTPANEQEAELQRLQN